VLRTVTYNNVAASATMTARSVTFVTNDGSDDSNVGTTTIEMVAGVPFGSLYLSTAGDVGSPSGAPGLDSWGKDEGLEFGGPGLNYEPGATAGSFGSQFSLDDFAADADLNAIHYVTTDITVGSANSIDLFVGDILLSTKDNETLTSTNTLAVEKKDVFVFRPDTPGDYSAGTFIMLLDNLDDKEVRAITLVEQDTVVGGSAVQAGTFLFADDAKTGKDADPVRVYHFTADDVGAGTTTGTTSVFIDGPDIGIGQKIAGIELIETPAYVGGTLLDSGSLLVSLETDDASVGDNGISALESDIFYLTVSSTGATTVADATLFFEGADVGLGGGTEDIDALSLVTNDPYNKASVLDLDADDSSGSLGVDFNSTFTEDGGAVAITDADATLTDINDAALLSLTVTITNQLDGVAETLAATTGATSIIASYDSGTGILSLTGADTVANYQQVLRTVTYNNSSQDPDTTDRIIEFVSIDSRGGSSSTATTTLAITAVNDPAVMDLDADDSSGSTGADFDTAFTEDGGAVAIADVDATLNDIDNVNLVS